MKQKKNKTIKYKTKRKNNSKQIFLKITKRTKKTKNKTKNNNFKLPLI